MSAIKGVKVLSRASSTQTPPLFQASRPPTHPPCPSPTATRRGSNIGHHQSGPPLGSPAFRYFFPPAIFEEAQKSVPLAWATAFLSSIRLLSTFVYENPKSVLNLKLPYKLKKRKHPRSAKRLIHEQDQYIGIAKMRGVEGEVE